MAKYCRLFQLFLIFIPLAVFAVVAMFLGILLVGFRRRSI